MTSRGPSSSDRQACEVEHMAGCLAEYPLGCLGIDCGCPCHHEDGAR